MLGSQHPDTLATLSATMARARVVWLLCACSVPKAASDCGEVLHGQAGLAAVGEGQEVIKRRSAQRYHQRERVRDRAEVKCKEDDLSTERAVLHCRLQRGRLGEVAARALCTTAQRVT